MVGPGEIVLSFPLYFLRHDDAHDLLAAAIDTLRHMTSGVPEPPIRAALPSQLALHPNFPNPFNARTEIQFDLPQRARVQLAIYNTLGQQVAVLVDETLETGTHRISWDASTVSSGVYICRIESAGTAHAMKMVLIR